MWQRERFSVCQVWQKVPSQTELRLSPQKEAQNCLWNYRSVHGQWFSYFQRISQCWWTTYCKSPIGTESVTLLFYIHQAQIILKKCLLFRLAAYVHLKRSFFLMFHHFKLHRLSFDLLLVFPAILLRILIFSDIFSLLFCQCSDYSVLLPLKKPSCSQWRPNIFQKSKISFA